MAEYNDSCPVCGGQIYLVAAAISCRVPVYEDGWALQEGPVYTSEEVFYCDDCSEPVPAKWVFGKMLLRGAAKVMRRKAKSKIDLEMNGALEEKDALVSYPGRYELVRVPGGRFCMGSPESEEGSYDWERPSHEVQVPDFYLGRYPVTNEEYGGFLRENPGVKEPKYWTDRRFNSPWQPVVGVSWEDARRYAAWAGLRLPSEAEWEYACRAGTRTRYYTGNAEKDPGSSPGQALDRAGWYDKNSGGKLHPVGEKEPNSFGLYDMHGNVWEWVADDWHENYQGAPDDGRAWIDKPRGVSRVLRGGAFFLDLRYVRCAYRYRDDPGYRYRNIGFRCAKGIAQ